MTNEEAIEALDSIDNCLKGDGYDWEHEAIKIATQSLKRQIVIDQLTEESEVE